MVKINPLRGFFYNLGKVGDISKVIAPPWDVIDGEYEKRLMQMSPYNVINLISKDKSPDDVSEKFNEWINQKILIEDSDESFYFLKQSFEVEGERKEREGFFALLTLEEFEKGNIIPHEKIFEKYKMNRYKLIEKCRANFSPVFMLYQDDKFIFEEMIESVEAEVKGNINSEKFSFGKISDKEKIEKIKEIFREKKVIIADGHHRYNAALHFYLDNPYPWAEKVLVFLVNINSPNLVILPTHRYIVENISFLRNRKIVENFFDVSEFTSFEEMKEGMNKYIDRHSFGVYENGKFYLLILKRKDVMEKISKIHSENWAELDTVILHEFILKEIFKTGKGEFLFHSSAEYLLDEYKKRQKGVIFFLNPIKKEQFLKICFAGEVMPHKSTYFYPKVPSGLIIHKFPRG